MPEPRTQNCRWIDVPGASDPRGRLNFIEVGKGLPFVPQRMFWLHDIRPGQWRGRHGHRRTELLFVPMHGACRLHLDDGRTTDCVSLDDPARAFHVGTWVWHELTDFTAGTVVLVVASSLYDESEYMRDYECFKREALARP